MSKLVTKKWVYCPTGKEKLIEELKTATGLTSLQVSILVNRGFDTVAKIYEFLEASLDDLLDTRLMKDAKKAIQIILKHIKAGSCITNYSDFDADGWGAAVTIYRLFKKIGVNINTFQNTAELGFGISVDGINEMLKHYPDTKLIITTDNGIVAFEAVEYAKSLGIDVIITDHHEPEENGEVPKADAVVDPKQNDCTYPYKDLCGAGVIFKLMMLLYFEMGYNPKDCYEVLDIVAVSTIADVVPLIGENRAIVKEGLKMIRAEERPVWRAMRETFVDSFYEPHINAKTIAFSYAPAINACRRMLGTILLPVELFKLEDDESNYEIMLSYAKYMKDINDERKLLTKTQTAGANAIWLDKPDHKVIVIHHESLNEGLAGLVAGRLKEEYNRPTFVLAPDEAHPGIYKGSGRSIDGFHAKEVLDKLKNEFDFFTKYGGHGLAAGLSLPLEVIPKFEEEVNKIADTLLTEEDFIKKAMIDWAFSDEELSIQILDDIRFLEPYGQGFPAPVIGLRGFKPLDVKELGDALQHVSLQGKNCNVVSWYGAETFKQIKAPYNLWAIGSLEYDAFAKKVKLQVEPEDFKNK